MALDVIRINLKTGGRSSECEWSLADTPTEELAVRFSQALGGAFERRVLPKHRQIWRDLAHASGPLTLENFLRIQSAPHGGDSSLEDGLKRRELLRDLRGGPQGLLICADGWLGAKSTEALSRLAECVAQCVRVNVAADDMSGLILARVVRTSGPVHEDPWDRLFQDAAITQLSHPQLDFRAHWEGPVLIEGPFGSGKTHFARAYAHQMSKKLIEFNFGHLGEGLLDSALRGIAAGRATDVREHKGVFQQADGGVLLLDDFQAATPSSQIRLLDLLNPLSDRVRVRRDDGFDQTFRVRVLIAVNEDTTTLLAQDRLRRDLLSRVRRRVRVKALGERSDSDRKRIYELMATRHGPSWLAAADANDVRYFRRLDAAALKRVAREISDLRSFEKLAANLLALDGSDSIGDRDFDERDIETALDLDPSAQGAVPQPVSAADELVALVRREYERCGWRVSALVKSLGALRKDEEAMKKFLESNGIRKPS